MIAGHTVHLVVAGGIPWAFELEEDAAAFEEALPLAHRAERTAETIIDHDTAATMIAALNRQETPE